MRFYPWLWQTLGSVLLIVNAIEERMRNTHGKTIKYVTPWLAEDARATVTQASAQNARVISGQFLVHERHRTSIFWFRVIAIAMLAITIYEAEVA
jgi:hypothetical protein